MIVATNSLPPEVTSMIQAAARRAGIADGVGYLDGEDVLSDLTLVALQAQRAFDPARGAKFTTFLWLRLWGEAVDLRRRHGRQLRDGQPRPMELPLEAAAAVEDRSDPPAAGLMQAISHLPGRERAALLLRDVGGVPAAEVGHVLGIGKSRAKDLRRQAVRRLHVAMER